MKRRTVLEGSGAAHTGSHQLTPRLQPEKTSRLTAALLMGALLGAGMFSATRQMAAAQIAVGVSVRIGPPPIPVYAQPLCPGPGYIWTPGYWAYDPDNGYYWVPGTWAMAPEPGMLWTPGYWGWGGAGFFWHSGYWGPHVGFYGGINYGFGYTGVGYVGGYWRGRDFYYNHAVNNFGDRHFDHFYNRPVANNFAVNRVSFNGGPGGLRGHATAGELAAEHDHHFEATPMQRQHETAAHGMHEQFANVNHGRPNVAATGRPGEFHGPGVTGTGRAANSTQGFHGPPANHTNSFSHGPNNAGAHPPAAYSHPSGPHPPAPSQGAHGGPPSQPRNFHQASPHGAPPPPHGGQPNEHAARQPEKNQPHGDEHHH